MMRHILQKAKSLGAYQIVNLVLVTLLALVFVYPIVWLGLNSFKTQTEVYRLPPTFFPEYFTVENFQKIFLQNPAWLWIKNSMVTSLLTAGLTAVTGTMAAYAFSKLQFYGKKWLYGLFILSIMVPTEILIVPLFNITKSLNLMDTSLGMAVPSIASAIGLFMMKGFIDALPSSIRESARIDGAGELRIFLSIILPLCKSGMGALFILSFVRGWNNYLWQMLTATRKVSYTLPVGVSTLFTESNPNIAYKLAGAFVGAVPMLIVFLCFQKYFTRGVTIGAEKG